MTVNATVFNPAAWTDGDTIWLPYRAEDSAGIGQWHGTSRIGLAHSTDGLQFERESEPILRPTETCELPGGCEDPRLVKIDDVFLLTYTSLRRPDSAPCAGQLQGFAFMGEARLAFPRQMMALCCCATAPTIRCGLLLRTGSAG